MIVGPTRNNPQSRVRERFRQNLRIIDNLLLIRLEITTQSLAKRNSFSCDNVYQRPALYARKYAAVDVFGKFFAAQYQTAARPAQGFMRRRSNKFAMRHRRRMQPNSDQTSDMRNVGHHLGSHALGYFADAFEIDRSRIR